MQPTYVNHEFFFLSPQTYPKLLSIIIYRSAVLDRGLLLVTRTYETGSGYLGLCGAGLEFFLSKGGADHDLFRLRKRQRSRPIGTSRSCHTLPM